MESGGLSRQYRVYRPAELPSATTPALVVVLHGASLNAEQTERYYHWDGAADADGFVVVYPQGIDDAWNAGSCCADAPALGTDDVGFVGSVISTEVAVEHADPARVYLAGVSNGAMLAYRFACQRPGVVAALGIVAGTFTSPCADPRPVSLMEIHGLADQSVAFYPGPDTSSSPSDLRLPAAAAIESFRAADGCTATTTTTSGVVHRQTSICSPGLAVVVITIDGAGHQWPGATIDAARLKIDGPENQPSTAIDATSELWAFFAGQHAPSPS